MITAFCGSCDAAAICAGISEECIISLFYGSQWDGRMNLTAFAAWFHLANSNFPIHSETTLIFLAPFNMHSVEFCSMDGLTFLVVGKFIGYEREQWLRYSSNFHFGSCVPVAHRIEIIKSSQFSRCLKLETYHMVESKFHEPSISICGIFCNCSVKCSWKLRWRVH